MEQSSSSSNGSGKDCQQIVSDPVSTPEAEQSSELPESESEPEQAPDGESEPDSDDDARDIIDQLIENVGLEVFEHVNDIDPSICPPCVNITCAFSEGLEAVRTPGKASVSMLMHHRSMKALSECSATCPMCRLLLHLLRVGGSDAAVLGQKLSRNERKLVRLLEQDKKQFKETIRDSETGLWSLRPWKIVLESAKAWWERQNGQWTTMNLYTGDKWISLDVPAERADILLKWARSMLLEKEPADVQYPPTDLPSSSESARSGADEETLFIEAPNDVQETSTSLLEPTKAPEENEKASSSSPPIPTYNIAVAHAKDMKRMAQLLVAANSLKDRYSVHSQGYRLREVRGFQGQSVELQLMYGKERYPARVFTTKGQSGTLEHLNLI